MNAPGRARGSGQSRAMSLIEATANVALGYGLAVLAQIAIFPVFGFEATLAQNLKLAAAFTLLSLARSYLLRRAFEALRLRGIGAGTAP